MKKRIALVLACSLSLSVAATCANGIHAKKHRPSAHKSTPHAVGNTIVVGAVVAETGKHMFEGRATRAGYEFWAAWVNSHGGIAIGRKHYRVTLIERDDESNPMLTSQLTERLIDEEQATFILGPYGSSETLAGAAVAERKGIPFITGTGASEKTFEQGYHNVFGVMAPARMYLRGIIDLAHHLHPKVRTVAILAANDSFSLEAQQGALQRAHDLGLRVVDSDQYAAGTFNFSTIAARLAVLHPDMLLNASHTEESIALTRSLYDANVQPKIHGEAVGADIPAFSYFLDALSDDTMSAAQWSSSVSSKGNPAFFPSSAPAYAQAFARFAKCQANSESASASAAGLALELALHQAGSPDPQRVLQSLAKLHAETFYGLITFDARGLNSAKPMLVNQLEVGKLYTIFPKADAVADPVYPARPWQDR